MNLHRHPIASAIASILACSLLAACGGGSAGSGQLRVSATSPPPPTRPPPPPASQAGPCPMPTTGTCIVTGEGTMLGGRTSNGQLVARLPSQGSVATALTIGAEGPAIDPALGRGTYTFAGGTRIESGAIGIMAGNVLNSDVTIVKPDGGVSRMVVAGTVNGRLDNADELIVLSNGTVRGHVVNQGSAWLDPLGRIEGLMENHGTLHVTAYHLASLPDPTQIVGDFRQDSAGVLNVSLPTSAQNVNYFHTLRISGSAFLSGTLVLRDPNDGWDNWPLPTTPSSAHILHSDGGVYGTFDRWTSPGLFIEGSLRYGSNDVWFDLTRISLAASMMSHGIDDPLTLASATNLDHAFDRTDALLASAPALSGAQRRLLDSAGSVLSIAELGQATRTLDSLSGAAHADALQATLQQGVFDVVSSRRMAAMQPGLAAGAWSNASAEGHTSGFDQWLSPRLLVGVQAGGDMIAMREGSAQASRLSPKAGAYLRWFGADGWYAGGRVGYGQHTLVLDRTLDFGRGGQWNAHSQQRFNVAGLQGEAGRRLASLGGTLTPYLALEASALRSEGSIEQGGTGFELALLPTMRANLGAALGLRYGRDWRLGDTGWLRLDADARLQRRLADAGDPLRAGFVGVPDLWFDVPGNPTPTAGWLDLGLRGGFTRAWSWSFDVARPWAGSRAGMAARLGVQRSF